MCVCVCVFITAVPVAVRGPGVCVTELIPVAVNPGNYCLPLPKVIGHMVHISFLFWPKAIPLKSPNLLIGNFVL